MMRNPFYCLAAAGLGLDLAYNTLRGLLGLFRTPLPVTATGFVLMALMAWNMVLVYRGSRPALILATVLESVGLVAILLGAFSNGFSLLGFTLNVVALSLCALALASDRRW